MGKHIDGIGGEAQVSEDSEQEAVVDGIESVREINIKDVNISIGIFGVLQHVHQALEVPICTLASAKGLLGGAEDAMVFAEC